MVENNLIVEITDQLLEKDTDVISNLKSLESIAYHLFCDVGRKMLELWLAENESLDPSPTTKCGWCGQDAEYVSNRPGFVRTRFGLVRYHRAYYLCPHCDHSTYPLDERLNPYASLARLRTRIAAGISLPVDEMAKAWGLASMTGAAPLFLSEAYNLH